MAKEHEPQRLEARWRMYILIQQTYQVATMTQRREWFDMPEGVWFGDYMARLYLREREGDQVARREFDTLFAKIKSKVKPFMDRPRFIRS